jgi:SAM-dependent methyltransferase
MKGYYDRRAPEYDATSYELVRASDDAADLDRLEAFVADIPSGRILDIACGTGWLTRLLRGEVVGVDQSEAMLRIARERVPKAQLVHAGVPPLPFDGDSFDVAFDVAFGAHIYSHLEPVAPATRARTASPGSSRFEPKTAAEALERGPEAQARPPAWKAQARARSASRAALSERPSV